MHCDENKGCLLLSNKQYAIVNTSADNITNNISNIISFKRV